MKKLLYAMSIALTTVSVFVIGGSLLCIVHGNLSAVLTLAVGLTVAWASSEFAEALHRRIH